MSEPVINLDDIVLAETVVGRDLLLVITGGERHIGAASTAYWNGESVEVQTSAVPHHKEHLVTEELAVTAAAALSRTVTVVMGIHYDNLSREGIQEAVRIVKLKFSQYLAQKNETS